MEPSSSKSPLNTDDERAIKDICHAKQDVPGGLLPILHDIQRSLGYVPAAAVPIIAEYLNLSRADVHGVISFYHFYRTSPPGQKTLYICRAEACQAMGSRELEAHAQQKLGVDYHGTTKDGTLSLEPVYCLGNCACSPAVMLDETVYGRVTPGRLDEILG